MASSTLYHLRHYLMLTNAFSLRNTLCSTPQADATCCERSNLRQAPQPLFLLTPTSVWPRVKRLLRQVTLLRTHLPTRWHLRWRMTALSRLRTSQHSTSEGLG